MFSMVIVTSKYFKIFNTSLECCVAKPQFFIDLSETFLNTSPRIAKLFDDIDSDGKATVMQEILYTLISLIGTKVEVDEEWTSLANRHKEMGVESEWYAIWLTSCVATVEEFDPGFNQEIKTVWLFMLENGIQEFTQLCEKIDANT